MKEIFQGNITKETADMIKQLEQSGGAGTEHTLMMFNFPSGWDGLDFLTTTASQQNIVEEFEYNQGKEFNERLYELFKSGVLNTYTPKGDSFADGVAKVEFRSIDEDGVITVYIEGAPETLTLPAPDDTTRSAFDGAYVDTSSGSVFGIHIEKKEGEQP